MHDAPVFVLGERAAAVRLMGALGETDGLCAIPVNRLLADLVSALERSGARLEPGEGATWQSRWPAHWYRDVQVAYMRFSGKPRTVEFSGLSILRLCALFPGAQFVVVRQLKRAMPPSRRPPPLVSDRILEVDSETVDSPDTFDHVMAFLGEPVPAVELDLSDESLPAPR